MTTFLWVFVALACGFLFARGLGAVAVLGAFAAGLWYFEVPYLLWVLGMFIALPLVIRSGFWLTRLSWQQTRRAAGGSMVRIGRRVAGRRCCDEDR